jgi:hypothetical protein
MRQSEPPHRRWQEVAAAGMTHHATTKNNHLGETIMKPLIALALFLACLTLGVGLSACSDDSGNYYENDTHGGYPGPGIRTPDRDS